MSCSSKFLDVWEHNFVEALQEMDNLAAFYQVIAVSTTFPGTIFSAPPGTRRNEYELIKRNVDSDMKLIQMSFTLSNGGVVKKTYQFNFSFNWKKDKRNPESIEFLKNRGIDFKRHATQGIQHDNFFWMFETSDLLSKPLTWISFQGGYTYAYLWKYMKGCDLPEKEDGFMDFIREEFAVNYDVKSMMPLCGVKGGLKDLCACLGVRYGNLSTAGDKSIMIMHAMIIIKKMIGRSVLLAHKNVIYPVWKESPTNASSARTTDTEAVVPLFSEPYLAWGWKIRN